MTSNDKLDAFWAEQAAKRLDWKTPWSQIRVGDFYSDYVTWFEGGTLNACFNCLDRHIPTRGDKTALIFEGYHSSDSRNYTFSELLAAVCQCANGLKQLGIKARDAVGIYMPMIPEAIICMLACERIGAVHTVVFAGFSSDSLALRLNDADCRLLITADGAYRGEKHIPLKAISDEALAHAPCVKHLMVINHIHEEVPFNGHRDSWYHDVVQNQLDTCEPEWMDSDDPLFILYTSGSTGKPKGVVHTHGGYLVYTATSFEYIFRCNDDDLFWCTADIGWITAHCCGVHGPLMRGIQTFIYEGIPTYPSPSQYWQLIDKYQITVLYTAPTVLRSLRQEGEVYWQNSSRRSLRLLGSVGEPINPDIWVWYQSVIGRDACSIVNTWGQTEMGGMAISPMTKASEHKPGVSGQPVPGIEVEVRDGQLLISKPWPGMMKTILHDHDRFLNHYLRVIPGRYVTGDLAEIDEEGDIWVKGRADDVIQVSGHRLGTEELESVLIGFEGVSEAGVVGVADAITGESIYAFVSLKNEIQPTKELKQQLIQHVREHIGPIATIKTIQWAKALPKTRSGKIMRRILRKIANESIDDLGDVSTLSDPSVISKLIQNRMEIR